MESTPSNSPAQFLKGLLLRRISQNRSYSVRAFARDLKISHSYLSQILNERRGLSLRQALLLSDALHLGKEEKQRFIQLLFENKHYRLPGVAGAVSSPKSEENTVALDMDRFRTVKEWYHGAILEMTTLKDFKANPQWIAKSLGITPLQARAAVNRLKRLGVLETKGKKWQKTRRRFQFPTTSLDEAVNGFHREMIYKAFKTLEKKTSEDFEARDITGITVAIDPKRIPEAKKRIQKFRNQLADFLSKGEPSEVYQLNVQLFALTDSKNNKRKRKHVLH